MKAILLFICLLLAITHQQPALKTAFNAQVLTTAQNALTISDFPQADATAAWTPHASTARETSTNATNAKSAIEPLEPDATPAWIQIADSVKQLNTSVKFATTGTELPRGDSVLLARIRIVRSVPIRRVFVRNATRDTSYRVEDAIPILRMFFLSDF